MKKKNFPRKLGLIITNSITLVRFLGIIPIISAFASGNVFLAGIITSIVGLTDKLDGICARKLNGYSKFGALFDATTDKIFALILNTLLTTINPLFWFNIVGELQIGSVNLYYLWGKNIKNNSTKIGKIKTVTLFSEYALSLLLINTPLNFLIPAMIIGNFALQQKVCREYIDKGIQTLLVVLGVAEGELYLYLARLGALDLYVLDGRITEWRLIEGRFALVEVVDEVDEAAVVLEADGLLLGLGDLF